MTKASGSISGSRSVSTENTHTRARACIHVRAHAYTCARKQTGQRAELLEEPEVGHFEKESLHINCFIAAWCSHLSHCVCVRARACAEEIHASVVPLLLWCRCLCVFLLIEHRSHTQPTDTSNSPSFLSSSIVHLSVLLCLLPLLLLLPSSPAIRAKPSTPLFLLTHLPLTVTQPPSQTGAAQLSPFLPPPLFALRFNRRLHFNARVIQQHGRVLMLGQRQQGEENRNGSEEDTGTKKGTNTKHSRLT